jgi:hypothetical protein
MLGFAVHKYSSTPTPWGSEFKEHFMATSGTLTVNNKTGVPLVVGEITTAPYGDAKFSGPSTGDTINNDNQATFAMSNNSIVIAPRGVGVDVILASVDNTRHVKLHLDIPGVGAHTLSYSDALGISVSEDKDPDQNAYTQLLT